MHRLPLLKLFPHPERLVVASSSDAAAISGDVTAFNLPGVVSQHCPNHLPNARDVNKGGTRHQKRVSLRTSRGSGSLYELEARTDEG